MCRRHVISATRLFSLRKLGAVTLQAELDGILKDYVGRESPLYFAGADRSRTMRALLCQQAFCESCLINGSCQICILGFIPTGSSMLNPFFTRAPHEALRAARGRSADLSEARGPQPYRCTQDQQRRRPGSSCCPYGTKLKPFSAPRARSFLRGKLAKFQ